MLQRFLKMPADNKLEFVICEEGVIAVITKPDGEVGIVNMSMDEFDAMCRAIKNL